MKSYRESQSTHLTFNTSFFFENVAVYEIMWRYTYCRAGQVTDKNIAHAHYMLDN
jgi:hypothetical protein